MAAVADNYRDTARERIDEVLGWNRIASRDDVLRLDPDARRLLKKDLEASCPFHRRGLPYRVWQTEVKVLFGLAAITGHSPPPAIPDQRGLFE